MKKNIVFSTVFFGSEKDSLIILKKALSLPYLKIATIVTQPPRPTGRGQSITPTPVEQFAKKNKLPLITPTKLNFKSYQIIKQQTPDLALLAAYGNLIPQRLINLFPQGIINVHPSLLPQFRGPTPVVQAILNNNRITGVSLFLIDNKIDHGPIIAQKKLVIKDNDTQESLAKNLFHLGAQLLAEKLPNYLEGHTPPEPQNHHQATFTKLLSRQDGQIKASWLKKALKGNRNLTNKVDRMIRAFYPWPGTYTIINGQRIKIISAHKEKNYLKLDLIQFPGRKPIVWNKNLIKSLFLNEI
ncbi:MAG: methionyl-tRNA formyltransferase [Candidatus Shapirobacteria bacterium]|nr:methionyl-tRNA formyltransferase [Candidatus Shapirobacteria bacterium]